ncbi:extensin [Streptomyces sp. MK5]|uniref:extensin n=1 Tax=Streptomyces sp. MK5 TaxID=3064253 RepID=UPI0027423F43|nr:extensin [Streptomyces sp. MK5]
MADEQYHWLDPDTAERLLRGEPLDTVDETVRDQAERLAAALYALAAEPQAEPPSAADAELPGEAAALAAFRKARAEQADAGAVRVDRRDAHARTPAGSGRFRRTRRNGHTAQAGRRSWGRPLRLALSGALVAGAVGGVAAATTGVLPTPFGGGEPTPAASASDRATHDGPSASSSPDGSPGGVPGDAQGGGPGASTPAGSPAGPAGPSGTDAGNTGRDGDSIPGTGATAGPGGGRGAGSDSRLSRLASDCRDLRDGKDLDADRKHALEGAAGGSSRVWTYCNGVLKSADGGGSAQGSGGSGQDDNDGGGGKGRTGGKGGTGGTGSGSGQAGQDGRGGQGGKGGTGGKGGDGDGGHIGGGRPATGAVGYAPLRPAEQTRTASPAPTAPPAETAAPAPAASAAAPTSSAASAAQH